MQDKRHLKRAHFLLAGSAFGLAACANGTVSPLVPLGDQAAGRRRYSPNARGPASLFQGYNSVFGDARSTVLQGTSQKVGGASKITCSVCTSAKEVASALEIDAALSVAYGPVGSVDAKTKYMNSLNITTYSISLVVHARHSEGVEKYIDVGLKPGIAVPSGNDAINAFVSGHGDSWISEITRGGEYFGTYTFFSETSEEQKNLEASLQASGLYNGVTVDAGVEAKVSNFLKTVQVTYTFKQEISGIMNPTFPTPDKFIDYALAFPSMTLDSPTIIGFASSGYEIVPGLDKAFKKVAENRRYFIAGNSKDPGGLAGDLATIAGIKNQATDIQATYTFYGYTGDTVFASRWATAKSDFDAIVNQMQTFENAATTSFPNLPLTSIQNGTPVLHYAIASSPDWGAGTPGDPFNDVDVRTYLQKFTRIAEVQLRGSSVLVEQILTTYEDSTGKYVKKHGGSGGTLTNPLQLLPGQRVNALRARINPNNQSILTSLHIAADDGRSITAGSSEGTEQPKWAVPDGGIVLGFHGRGRDGTGSIAFVYQIGVDYAVIKPAKWVAVP